MGYKLKRILIYPDGITEKQVYPAISWNGDLSKIGTPTTFTLSSPMVSARTIQFKPDGTRFYTSGYRGDNQVGCIQQYSCSTPRDITTATLLNSVSIGTSGRWGNYGDMLLANNGQYLYFFNLPTNADKLYVYSLATAWDINSTKTEIANYSGYLQPMWMSEDGKAFMWDEYPVFKYSTSNTAWVINTSGTQIANIASGGITMSTGGNFLYVLSNAGQLTKYSLATPYDPTSTQTQEQQVTITANMGLFFDDQGNNMYSVKNTTVYQYSLV